MNRTYKKNNPHLRQPKMQHIRHVKPEFFVHEGVNNMTTEARLAEIGTWTCCDKHGRFEWKPRTLKRLIMPEDNIDFEPLMEEWIEQGFVEKYELDGQMYGRFLNWEKHQGIGTREKQSPAEYPAPPLHHASTVPAQCSDCAMSEGMGVGEGEGKSKGKQPTIQHSDGGTDGGLSALTPSASKTFGQGKIIPLSAFDSFLNTTLQEQWTVFRIEFMEEQDMDETDPPETYPPVSLQKSGRDKLQGTIRQAGLNVANAQQAEKLGAAFQAWLADRYARDFDNNRIQQPLSIFADEFSLYLLT